MSCVAAPIPDAFTIEEMKRLLETASAWPGEYCGVSANLWWETIIRVAYDTGERIGAVLRIEKTHVLNDCLMIPATSRKGRRTGRRFKVSGKTQKGLESLKAIQTQERLFALPWNYSYFWKVFGTVLESAGLPYDRRGKWHKVRRTVSTYYEAAGGNATQLLGHSSRKVTEAYIDTRYVQTPQSCNLIEAI